MRVTVNSLAVPSCRQGGAGFYAVSLIEGLSRREDVEQTVLASAAVAAELTELAPRAKVSVAAERRLGGIDKAVNYLAAARRPWTLDLGFAAEPPIADLAHWPISFMNAPAPTESVPKALTVHDLQHEVYPQFFSRRDLLLRRLRWGPSAKAADHVITISEFSRRMICERWGLAPERVTAVPLGVRATLAPSPSAPLPQRLRGVERWVFYPASPLGAKNHARLLEAMKLVCDRGESEAKLVLTGPTMHSWAAVEERITELGLGDRVLLLGHVSEAEMVNLYARASGLVFPSLFEGFGLPVLEAMGAGCPVAISAAASLPEIAGEAGRTFDPEDTEQIATAIEWLLALEGVEREQVRAAGREQASKFSLERMVEGTVGVYGKLAR